MKPDDTVRILIGPFKDRIAVVEKVEMNAGAVNGWITVTLDGGELLFAGEELDTIPASK